MWKKVVFGILIVLSAVIGFGVAKVETTMNNTLNHVTRDNVNVLKDVDLDGIKVESDNEIVNILLIGYDLRKEQGKDFGGLTDTMMIATLDKKHNSIKLTSLMRDMLVTMANDSKIRKMNAAYGYGGVKNMYKTIAQNFNIKLDGYAMVGFKAFQDVVDKVGGVEVELTPSELQYLQNTNYIKDKKNRQSLKLGKQVVNGDQALGYCRIRSDKKRFGIPLVTPNGLTDDYGRTWRQRALMSSIFAKVKKISISEMLEVADKVLENVKTDLENDDIIGYVKDVAMIGNLDVKQLQIPMNGYYRDGHKAEFPDSSGWSLVPTNGVTTVFDTSVNADAMQQFIFKYNGKGEFKYQNENNSQNSNAAASN